MFLRVCSARIAPTTSRHATHPATCPLALAALTAPSAPTGTRGRAARRAPFPIATTTPLLQPAKSAATWRTMLSSSSPCYWPSSSFSLCCALPASAGRACSPGSQAGWHSFGPQCNTLGFRPSGSPQFEPYTSHFAFEVARHCMHRFKLLLSFGQVWLVRESVYGLYATQGLEPRARRGSASAILTRLSPVALAVLTAPCRVDSATGCRSSRR